MAATVVGHPVGDIFLDPAGQIVDRPQRCLQIMGCDIGKLLQIRVRTLQVADMTVEQRLVMDLLGHVLQNEDQCSCFGLVWLVETLVIRVHWRHRDKHGDIGIFSDDQTAFYGSSILVHRRHEFVPVARDK